MLKTIIFPIAAVIAVSACVTSSDVVPIGNGNYALVSTARGGLLTKPTGKQQLVAIKKATEFCNNSHKQMVVNDMAPSGSSWNATSTQVVFKCE